MSTKIHTKDYKEFYLDYSDVTIALQDTDRVLPGDVVERVKGKWQTAHRADHPLLVGLLDVKSKYVYGMSSRGVPQYLFTPYNESYPPFIVGCSTKDRSHNKIVLVRFDSWENGQKFPRGALVETLGNAGDLKVEAKALYLQYSPWTFKKDIIIPPFKRGLDVIREVDEDSDSDSTITHEDHKSHTERVDLTEKYTFNIDPAGCKDIDDVLTIYEKDDKTWILVITISDVAELVDTNGELDQHAVKTGQSLYSHFLPPRNMLPAKLSEDELSLLPGKQRLGVSLFCEFYCNTFLSLASKFHLTVIENKKSFTYDSFVTEAPSKVVDAVRDAAAAISNGPKTDDPHKWIETIMIYYNSEVAKKLAYESVGIFRGQKKSQADLKERYEQICPELAHEAAVYTTAADIMPHTALGKDQYCYASSPIRRYVDIVNQRFLKAILLKDWYDIAITKQIDSTELVEQQNRLQKGAKRQSRDDFLLAQIAAAASKTLEGVVFDVGESIKVYVPAWKRIVKVRTWTYDTPAVGTNVTLKYFYNPDQNAWKNKIVFALCDTPTL